jgi:hypothetical protein
MLRLSVSCAHTSHFLSTAEVGDASLVATLAAIARLFEGDTSESSCFCFRFWYRRGIVTQHVQVAFSSTLKTGRAQCGSENACQRRED